MKRTLWPAGTYGDFDHGVNKAINRLRQALGDSVSYPRFIETIRGKGYRFLAPMVHSNVDPQTQTLGQLRLTVLPFTDLGGAWNDGFAEGLTEELTIQLGQIQPERLAVAGHHAAARCKSSGIGVSEIATELNLSHWVEGSVRRFRERVRISARLIEVQGETQLWAENYERSITDVFALQSETARMISQLVAFKLLPENWQSVPRAEFQKSVSNLETQGSSSRAMRPV